MVAPKAVVVGAGMGGLASAAVLAHRGFQVQVLELGPDPGGKAGRELVDGAAFDTGPSLLTMPDVLERVYALVGERAWDHVTLRKLSPAFRYLYPDGLQLDLHHELGATLDSVRSALGPKAAQELEDFLRYAAKIWDASAPAFVYGDAPTPKRLAGLDLTTLAGLRHIDAASTMWGALCKRVSDPKLRDLLARYATYNGSDARKAPATLHCIAHVELALGGFGVEGGLYALAQALAALAERKGAQFSYKTQVQRVLLESGHVCGVQDADGRTYPAQVVVCNADARHLLRDLLGQPDKRKPSDDEPSMSGWNAVFRTSAPAQGRASHAVIFPNRAYIEEFADIFDRRQWPADPTVYACDQRLAHGLVGWPEGAPLFVMVNAPAQETPLADAQRQALRALVRARLESSGLLMPSDPLVWERAPDGLARRFPGSGGSLYGAASNSMWSAFRRPANRSPLARGLYLASGSAHPGGGVPLCLLSGLAAARAALADCG